MANVFVDDESLKSIGNAIRTKLGVETTYLPSDMAEAVLSIPTGGGSELPPNVHAYRVTVVSDTVELVIPHNLAVAPTVVCMMILDDSIKSVKYSFISAMNGVNYIRVVDNNGNFSSKINALLLSVDDNNFIISGGTNLGNYRLRAGNYYVIAVE